MRNLMKKLFLSLIFFMVLLPVHAEEEEVSATDETAEYLPDTSGSPVMSPNPQGSSDAFIPSEIISEDLSVPFPVDI